MSKRMNTRSSVLCAVVLLTTIFPLVEDGSACSISMPPPDYSFVLLPVATRGWAGAHGSEWVTELSLFNGSSRTLDLRSYEDPDLFPLKYRCLFAGECDVFPSVPSLASFDLGTHLHQPADAPIPAMYLYMSRTIAPQLNFSLRARDITRESESWGTEIPVIERNELKNGTMQLLDIPTDPRFRITLRIYETSNAFFTTEQAPRFLVRIYRMDSPGDRHELELTIPLKPGNRSGDWARSCSFISLYPNYAEVTSEMFATLNLTGRVRFEITPIDRAKDYWAFVTLTNNVTQQVTTITPQ